MPQQDKLAIAKANAKVVAELFGNSEPITFDLPLKDGGTMPLQLYEPTAREVMEIIATAPDEFLLAQSAIELVTCGVEIPASKITTEGYAALRHRCYDLCCFIQKPKADDDEEDQVEPAEGDTPRPLSPSS